MIVRGMKMRPTAAHSDPNSRTCQKCQFSKPPGNPETLLPHLMNTQPCREEISNFQSQGLKSRCFRLNYKIGCEVAEAPATEFNRWDSTPVPAAKSLVWKGDIKISEFSHIMVMSTNGLNGRQGSKSVLMYTLDAYNNHVFCTVLHTLSTAERFPCTSTRTSYDGANITNPSQLIPHRIWKSSAWLWKVK